ncbi:unnamed protein product [Amoebophrya sp. A25]|nr:unnamed protein product [Amoebophrya sp. A25]CAD7976969.1 unnamed protein product [Amoebophrya sp. A25]|eukprot:GSA25T00027784001.1
MDRERRQDRRYSSHGKTGPRERPQLQHRGHKAYRYDRSGFLERPQLQHQGHTSYRAGYDLGINMQASEMIKKTPLLGERRDRHPLQEPRLVEDVPRPTTTGENGNFDVPSDEVEDAELMLRII